MNNLYLYKYLRSMFQLKKFIIIIINQYFKKHYFYEKKNIKKIKYSNSLLQKIKIKKQ